MHQLSPEYHLLNRSLLSMKPKELITKRLILRRKCDGNANNLFYYKNDNYTIDKLVTKLNKINVFISKLRVRTNEGKHLSNVEVRCQFSLSTTYLFQLNPIMPKRMYLL